MSGKGYILSKFSFYAVTHTWELKFKYGSVDWEGIFGRVVYSAFALYLTNFGLKFKILPFQFSALIEFLAYLAKLIFFLLLLSWKEHFYFYKQYIIGSKQHMVFFLNLECFVQVHWIQYWCSWVYSYHITICFLLDPLVLCNVFLPSLPSIGWMKYNFF